MAPKGTEFNPTHQQLMRLYQGLLKAYGPQAWWPAESPFEVAVGAVLTQNTNWRNVEKALQQLRADGLLSLEGMLASNQALLAERIRATGYFRLKAKRLKHLCEFLYASGGLAGLAEMTIADSRAVLLSVNGVGPETADDILLYALNKPVFVIDTYTRRLLARYALASGDEGYEVLRMGFERVLPDEVRLFKQFHALIVQHAKVACRKTPVCELCRLRADCPSGD